MTRLEAYLDLVDTRARVQLRGPRGSGTSRIFDEIVAILTRRFGRAPVRLRPSEPGDVPLECVRRAILSLYPAATRGACEAALRAVLPSPSPEAEAMTSWVLDGGDTGRPAPSPARLGRLLASLAAGLPLLVDDGTRLDPMSSAVYRGAVTKHAQGYLFGSSGDEAADANADDIELDALGEAQIALLLRRWLRHPVTVRRLLPELMERYGGRPGHVVRALRRLGREGHLAAETRGVTIHTWPLPWPEPGETEPFGTWVERLSGPERDVLESAAIQGPWMDAEVLALAAGVKHRVVDDLRTEASEFGPRVARELFPDASARADLVATMDEPTRRRRRERLAAAWREVPLGADRGVEGTAARLRTGPGQVPPGERTAALTALLGRLPPGTMPRAPLLDLLRDVARELVGIGDIATSGRAHLVARVGDLLQAAERTAEAQGLLASVEGVDTPPPLSWLWRQFRMARGKEADEARTRLVERLASPDGSSMADRFDAWRCIADVDLARGDVSGARTAWRRALHCLAPGHVRGAQQAHRGLAALAGARGVLRAQAAHLRREARLLLSLGRPREAARRLLERARVEYDAGHTSAALGSWQEAAVSFARAGDVVAQAETLQKAGEACLALSASTQAIDLLHRALHLIEHSPHAGGLRASTHLLLARVSGLRGDARQEERHAAAADDPEADARTRLCARTLLLGARVRQGDPRALAALPDLERELAREGLVAELRRVRRARLEARLRAEDRAAATIADRGGRVEPELRLRRARLALLTGRTQSARHGLEALAADARVEPALRLEACVRLAHASLRAGDGRAAQRAAACAVALVETQPDDAADSIRRRLAVSMRRLIEGVGAPRRSQAEEYLPAGASDL